MQTTPRLGSVFNADGSVAIRSRSESILDQIERQITANGGDASGIPNWRKFSEA